MFRVRIHGAPAPRGWCVKYLSGMEEVKGIKAGYWLTQWYRSQDNVATFNFEPELVLSFETEAKAASISRDLRESTRIETTVMKMGT